MHEFLDPITDRRAEFEAFIRTRGEEERGAKIAAVQRLKEARLALSTLLESKVTACSGSACPSLADLRYVLRSLTGSMSPLPCS